MSVADIGTERGALASFLMPARTATLIALVMAAMVAVWPLGLQGDYFNHLARTYIEGHLPFDAALRQYYEVSFGIVPNLTLDMIVPWLSHLIGIYASGAIMAWAGFVAAPLGGIFLARALHGRVTWVSLCAFLVMFNQNMQWGFINFSVSCGLALFGFALWSRSAPTWRSSLLFSAFGLFLVFNHALGFLLFGYLVLLWEIGCFRAGERGSLLDFAKILVTKDAVSMVPALAIILFATGGAGQLPEAGRFALFVPSKLGTLWSAALFFNVTLATLVCFPLIFCFFSGLSRGLIALDQRMRWVCSGTVILVLVMPVTLAGIWGMHFRYPAIAFILLAASVRFREGAELQKRLAAVAAAGLMIAVFANAALVMARSDEENRALREVLANVPVGARVLPAASDQAQFIATIHAVDMAVIERSAFVPDLFTNTSLVNVVRPMRRQHMPQAWPLTAAQLAGSESLPLPASQNGYWSPDYYFGWPEHWDYVVYFHGKAKKGLDLPSLCPVASIVDISLYRTAKGRCPAS